MYGILMLQEKIKGERLADKELREEDPSRAGVANLDPATIEAIAGPFGNSTSQNKVSGLVSTRALQRPSDRRP